MQYCYSRVHFVGGGRRFSMGRSLFIRRGLLQNLSLIVELVSKRVWLRLELLLGLCSRKYFPALKIIMAQN